MLLLLVHKENAVDDDVVDDYNTDTDNDNDNDNDNDDEEEEKEEEEEEEEEEEKEESCCILSIYNLSNKISL